MGLPRPADGSIDGLTFRLFKLDGWVEQGISLGELCNFWCDMVTSGLKYLHSLPARRVLSLRYEEVLERPQAEPARFMEFLGPAFADEPWLEQATKVPARPPSSWHNLPAAQRDRLTAACGPGLRLLGYA